MLEPRTAPRACAPLKSKTSSAHPATRSARTGTPWNHVRRCWLCTKAFTLRASALRFKTHEPLQNVLVNIGYCIQSTSGNYPWAAYAPWDTTQGTTPL